MTPGFDGFFRNQGVGSWEINLAAFLADLNTNEWNSAFSGGVYSYLTPFGINNTGAAFNDALALLSYRYNFNYNWQASAFSYFTNVFNYPYNIDGYSDGSLQLTLNTNAGFVTPDQIKLPWSGADNTNHFFTLGDLLDPSKVGGSLNGFTNHLLRAGNATDTYDRYTYYRLLAQLGSGSPADAGKLNLNYANAAVTYSNAGGVAIVTSVGVIAGAETNLVPWVPQNFFLAAADKLLRLYSTNWFQSSPSNYLYTYYGLVTDYNDPSGYGLTNYPIFGLTNQVPAFGVGNIPVLVNGRFVYSPAINRLLQLAANVYDASTNGNNNLPHVFRPIFGRDNNGDIFIVSYLAVTNVTGQADVQLRRRMMPRNYHFPALLCPL